MLIKTFLGLLYNGQTNQFRKAYLYKIKYTYFNKGKILMNPK